jgi:hypothetical protein
MTARPLVVLTLIAAGCGSGTPTGSTEPPTTRKKAVTFSECMREHGVKQFPDPDGSGELTLDGVVNGSSLDPDSATWKRAIAACQDLQPAGFTGGKRSDAQQDAALVFAECIRKHGVTDFPDPVNGEPLVDTRKIPSTDSAGGMTVLNAAMDKCGALAEKAMEQRK